MNENTYFEIFDELVVKGMGVEQARATADDILDAMESGMSKHQAMTVFNLGGDELIEEGANGKLVNWCTDDEMNDLILCND
jgi:hypothetical protein|tara:strand:+ start:2242 stop:2484 length:243 start_codon:yes stop_codon:yes gene_type:complete